MANLQHELEAARALAFKAGAVVRASYAKLGEGDVDEKGRHDFVPVVDYDSQIAQARSLVAQDPGRVAQVVKTWVGNDE